MQLVDVRELVGYPARRPSHSSSTPGRWPDSSQGP